MFGKSGLNDMVLCGERSIVSQIGNKPVRTEKSVCMFILKIYVKNLEFHTQALVSLSMHMFFLG